MGTGSFAGFYPVAPMRSRLQPVNEKPLTRPKIPGWPIAAALAVLFLYFYYVRIVLLPFVLAGAAAFILSPAVDKLHRHLARLPRWVAAVTVYLLVLAVVGAFGFWLGPGLADDVTQVADAAPRVIQGALTYIAPTGKIVFMGETVSASAASQTVLEGMRAYLLSGAGLSLAAAGFGALLGAFLTLVLLAYFLISGPTLRHGLTWLVPPEYRGHLHELTRGVGPMLRRYFIGLFLIVSYAAGLSLLFFGGIFRIAHAPLLSLLIGVLELVPIFGPIISAALVVVTAFEQASLGLTIGFIAFILALRLSIDQIVGPLVLGQAAYLHPVAVIFAFLTGAVFLGVLGLLLAVPVAATIKIVLGHYYRERLSSS
jgi:predicted PurR-regulated permease PerM